MDPSHSIINLGDLSKPANTLIEKISDAIGGIFKPYQIRRIAQAEAEAEKIEAVSQIEIGQLQRHALRRFLAEEAKKQNNIESITSKALPEVRDEAKPENVEDDWITNFFDKCRIISDEEMQQLWSRVLAGEANSPGSFSKRTVNLLSSLDKTDAHLFTRLCGFAWVIGGTVPLVFDHNDDIYKRHDINFNALSHLESIGLIQFGILTGFVQQRLPKKFTVAYYGRLVDLNLPNDSDNLLELGQVLLTRSGRQLASICGSSPVEGFFDFVYAKWALKSYVP